MLILYLKSDRAVTTVVWSWSFYGPEEKVKKINGRRALLSDERLSYLNSICELFDPTLPYSVRILGRSSTVIECRQIIVALKLETHR